MQAGVNGSIKLSQCDASALMPRRCNGQPIGYRDAIGKAKAVVMVGGSVGTNFLALFVLALAPTAGASAQTAPDLALQKFVQTSQYQSNIARLFSVLPPDVFQRCPALVSRGSSINLVKPVNFAPDGYPVSGVWKQSFPVSGCGNDTTINFYFSGQANEQIASLIAAPGDTHADLTLQRDAVHYAMIEVHPMAAACKTPHVRNTRFEGRFTDETVAGKLPGQTKASGWRETWTISACGQFFAVPLTFIPDATGTTIVAGPPKEVSH